MMRYDNRRRAFTLMELLVVIAIIGVLVAIVLGVAGSVTNTGKAGKTRDTIRVLETALEEYSGVKGARPAFYIADSRSVEAGDLLVIPIADARDMSAPDDEKFIINSSGLLLEQMREVSSAYEIVASTLDGSALKPYSPSPPPIDDMRQPLLPTPMDAWGNPIRYVHPALDGLLYGNQNDLSDPSQGVEIEDDLGIEPPQLVPPAVDPDPQWLMPEIRRNAEATGNGLSGQADSDGGRCPGDQGYFYSAGPDGDPSTIEDNVYGSVRPAARPEES